MATANIHDVNKINKAMRSVSKGEDMKEDMALLMAPNASWEHFLIPAPMSIALLGELMLISTDTDFSLDKNAPKDGFSLLKWPKSFRACLAQVGHSGWDAFNEAHKNMDQIRLYSGNVPTHLKKAVQILLKADREELEEMLPIPLGNIKMTADRCLKLATSVEDKFVHVMKLTAELLEACTNARGQYEKDSKDTDIAIAVAKQHEQAAKEQKAMADEQYQQLKKHVKDSEKKFNESMDKMPSGWEMIGMGVVEGLANGLNSFVSAVTFQGKGKKKESHQGTGTAPPPSSKVVEKQKQNDCRAYNCVHEIKLYYEKLVITLIDERKLNSEKLARSNDVKWCSEQISRTRKYICDIGGGQSPVIKQALEFCKRALDICSALERISREMHHDPNEIDLIVKNMLELEDDISMLSEEGKTLYASNPLPSKAPNQAVWSPDKNTDSSIVQQTVKNARFKIEHAAAHLKHTQEKYDNSCDKLKESSQKLSSILADMAKLDIQKIDFDKIKETLIKGIRALGEVREQWGKLVLFFQMMSNLIECSLNTSLKNFLEYSNTAQQRSFNGYTISSFTKDMIYQEAFEASKIAHLVTMISGSYVEVSGKFLVHRVASLSKLLAFDVNKDEHEIRQERKKLHDGCREAQEGIEELVMQRKREFDGQVQKRMRKIKCELEAALPPAPPSEKRAIEEIVKASVAKVKEVELPTSTLDADEFA